jgi:hypothetical protein
VAARGARHAAYKRQVLRTRRPTGLDRVTLTPEHWRVKLLGGATSAASVSRTDNGFESARRHPAPSIPGGTLAKVGDEPCLNPKR